MDCNDCQNYKAKETRPEPKFKVGERVIMVALERRITDKVFNGARGVWRYLLDDIDYVDENFISKIEPPPPPAKFKVGDYVLEIPYPGPMKILEVDWIAPEWRYKLDIPSTVLSNWYKESKLRAIDTAPPPHTCGTCKHWYAEQWGKNAMGRHLCMAFKRGDGRYVLLTTEECLCPPEVAKWEPKEAK